MIQEYYEESSSSLMKTIGVVKKYDSANKLIELILAPIQIHFLICLKMKPLAAAWTFYQRIVEQSTFLSCALNYVQNIEV